MPYSPSFLDPQSVIDSVGIRPGYVIADFGSGAGRFTIEAARALVSTGRVYAIDVQPDLSTHTAALARQARLVNVDVIVGNVEKPRGVLLADGCVDVVIMSNLLFQLSDKKSALVEAKRVLKPAGRVLVIDWQDRRGISEGVGGFDALPVVGPSDEHIVTQADALALFERSGFSPERIVDAGSHHYGYVFKKL